MNSKIMYVCEPCQENNAEACGYTDRNMLRVTSSGTWLCEACWTDGDSGYRQAGTWDEAPQPPEYAPSLPALTANERGTDRGWPDAVDEVLEGFASGGLFEDYDAATALLGRFRTAVEAMHAERAQHAEIAAAVQGMDMIQRDNKRMRTAGTALAEAALYTVREYDGTHRLALAVAEWSKAVADEGDRAIRARGTTDAAERSYPAGLTEQDHIAHDMRMKRFPKRSDIDTFVAERNNGEV